MSSPFTRSVKLPMCCSKPIPRPDLDPCNSNCIIVSTYYSEIGTTPAIYRLNIETNESTLLYKYTEGLTPSNHGQFVDLSNNTLTLYGGKYNTFLIFNLKINKMIMQTNTNHTSKNSLSRCGNFVTNEFIPSNNEIHILDEYCNQYKYSIIKKDTIRLKSNSLLKSHNIDKPKLLYVETHKKVFVFGSWWSKLIFEYYNTGQNGVWKWRMSKIQMPYEENSHNYDILQGFQNILFVFYFRRMQIYIYDLFAMKWYQSIYNFPSDFRDSDKNCYVIKINNSAHVIDFNKNIHMKCNLFDLLPNEIKISHQKYSQVLITRYVREKEKELVLEKLSNDLISLILNYYLFS